MTGIDHDGGAEIQSRKACFLAARCSEDETKSGLGISDGIGTSGLTFP
jgi:hypothetical protein